MLRDHKLLIDKNCPMCRVYGTAFTKMNLVDNETIIHYQTAEEEIFAQINQTRAKSEIALHNTKSGDTTYGADAFMKILAGKSRMLKWIFSLTFLRFLARKLYRFVSFNRHVISGTVKVNGPRDCSPPMHKAYRWSFILITALFTGFIVNLFAVELDARLGVEHEGWREYLICFGQIIWQFAALGIINAKKRLDYLGNMSTVSLVGALLLLPLLGLNALFTFDLIVLGIGFMGVVGIMFLMHVKRCKRLGLPLMTSISWIAFRSVVLILIVLLTNL